MQVENGSVSSVRQAASVCGVSAPVLRRWLTLGLLSQPPWTLQQLREIRDNLDPKSPPSRLSGGSRHLDAVEYGMQLHPMPRSTGRRR